MPIGCTDFLKHNNSAVTVTNIGIAACQGVSLSGRGDTNFDSRAAVTWRRVDRKKSFAKSRLRM